MLRKEEIEKRIKSDLGKLEEYRQDNDLSKQRMADKLGVNPVSYENWRIGRNTPTVESWLQIQHFLDS